MKKQNKVSSLISITISIIFVLSIFIYARQNGIVGRTKKNGIGCGDVGCHVMSPSQNVSVVISGPDTLGLGQSATYTVTITGGPLVRGGTNIAAQNGTINPISTDLRKESGELTHVQPKAPSGGAVTFQFTYTAPNSSQTDVLYANGNSVNFNGQNTGDEWNFAQNKSVVIMNVTDVKKENILNTFALEQNYPNPFNPNTTIKYQVAEVSKVELKVYDIIGREVGTLVNETKSPGSYTVNFNAASLASGVYLYRLQANKFVSIRKMILLK